MMRHFSKFMSLPKGNLSVSIWSFGSIEFRRRFAKASTKTASKGKTKKKTQKTGRPQPLPKITDPKIESKLTQCLDLFEKIKAPDHEMTEEELNVAAQIAKEYSRQKMFQHRLWQSDMIMKERLTRSAILALPPHLRDEALKEDDTPIPMRLPFPTDTPPREWN